MNNEEHIAPWYKQPWFWFLLIFPGAAIIWCISMITVSLNIDNSMVTDDYAKEGRGIAMEMARDEAANNMGLSASLEFSERAAVLSMEASKGQVNYPYLVLNLFHPTLSEQDRTIQFRPVNDDGRYRATLNQPIEGRWYFDLRGPDNDWRLKGETRLPMTDTLVLDSGTEKSG